jgi:hypothetical protein
MFRMYASEVLAGPLSAAVLVLPWCWKLVLRRVLDHRIRDGARFETKELVLFVLFGLVTAFMAFWLVFWRRDATSSTKTWLAIAGCAAALAALPRFGRWIPASVYWLQSCTPCCVRFFSKMKMLKVESPYGESMWGGAASREKVKLGPDGKPLPNEKNENDGLTVMPVYPLSKVIDFEIATDEVKFKSIEDMRRLGKPDSALVFPAFQSYKVFDELERTRSNLLLPASSFSIGVQSPSSSVFDDASPMKQLQKLAPVSSPAGSELPLRPAASFYSTSTMTRL